jgi:hypothetical protein
MRRKKGLKRREPEIGNAQISFSNRFGNGKVGEKSGNNSKFCDIKIRSAATPGNAPLFRMILSAAD